MFFFVKRLVEGKAKRQYISHSNVSEAYKTSSRLGPVQILHDQDKLKMRIPILGSETTNYTTNNLYDKKSGKTLMTIFTRTSSFL